MDAPVCATCAKAQLGVVHLHWSEGAVIYCCRYCGAFNELPEVASLRSTERAGNSVTMHKQTHRSQHRS